MLSHGILVGQPHPVARLNHRHCIVYIFFNNLTIFITLPQRSCHDPKDWQGMHRHPPRAQPLHAPRLFKTVSPHPRSLSLLIQSIEDSSFFTKKSSNFENWRTNYRTRFELEVQLIADMYLLRQRYTQVAFNGGHHFLLSFCYSINQYLFWPKMQFL